MTITAWSRPRIPSLSGDVVAQAFRDCGATQDTDAATERLLILLAAERRAAAVQALEQAADAWPAGRGIGSRFVNVTAVRWLRRRAEQISTGQTARP